MAAPTSLVGAESGEVLSITTDDPVQLADDILATITQGPPASGIVRFLEVLHCPELYHNTLTYLVMRSIPWLASMVVQVTVYNDLFLGPDLSADFEHAVVERLTDAGYPPAPAPCLASVDLRIDGPPNQWQGRTWSTQLDPAELFPHCQRLFYSASTLMMVVKMPTVRFLCLTWNNTDATPLAQDVAEAWVSFMKANPQLHTVEVPRHVARQLSPHLIGRRLLVRDAFSNPGATQFGTIPTNYMQDNANRAMVTPNTPPQPWTVHWVEAKGDSLSDARLRRLQARGIPVYRPPSVRRSAAWQPIIHRDGMSVVTDDICAYLSQAHCYEGLEALVNLVVVLNAAGGASGIVLGRLLRWLLTSSAEGPGLVLS